MAILALGVSHRRAPLDLLERLTFDDDSLVKAYRHIEDEPAVDGAVILSTCNRAEIYGSVAAYHAGFVALKRLLCGSRPVGPDEVDEPLYAHYETDAVEHALTVASGLDSMVVGEPQILSQVRAALRRARAEGAADRTLVGLFNAAARAGRRVRNETAVGAAPDAFVRAGAEQAAEAVGGLGGRHAVVVGAGQMASLAVRHLRERGVATVRVLNRSRERARTLAERHDTEHGVLDDLPRAIVAADVLVSATGAAGVVVSAETIRDAVAGRGRPLFVLDLAVPRDVEPAAAGAPGVTLVDVDGLRDVVAQRSHEVATDIERARAIVRDETARFELRRRSERLAPLIRALRGRGDDVVAAELERFRSELASLTGDERAAVESLARGVVAKLLHDPIVRLKERSASRHTNAQAHAAIVADLFGLEFERE